MATMPFLPLCCHPDAREERRLSVSLFVFLFSVFVPLQAPPGLAQRVLRLVATVLVAGPPVLRVPLSSDSRVYNGTSEQCMTSRLPT